MTSSQFSSVLRLTSVDDFIAPSQECIKPLKTVENQSNTGSKIKIGDGSGEKQDIVDQPHKLDPISLSDCLSCSGCITSAETVLITQQSSAEILKILEENKAAKKNGSECRYIVLSLSVQPILSLAERFGLSPEETALKITGYFKEKGVHVVHTMTIAEELALCEIVSEFILRYKERKNSTFSSPLPMFASACPGWICYAEKTHDFILPHISKIKSPQQVMGSLVKAYYARENNIEPNRIYHITLMPCYDKKLEASRNDFYDSQTNAKDVDCVITAVEMEHLLQEEGIALADVTSQTFDKFEGIDSAIQNALFIHSGSASGGYAYHVLENAAQELFSLSNIEIEFKAPTRNADLKECKISHEGETLNVAIINGFRNIQNLIQKMKKKLVIYDYVEIMACPSGCINGSALIKGGNRFSMKELTRKLDISYYQLPKRNISNYKITYESYENWLRTLFQDNKEVILRTSYHGVKSNTLPLNIKW